MRGFVHGYNKYLSETGVSNLPDACRDKPWVREITEMDAYRRFYQLGLIASQGVVIDGIGAAEPLLPGAPIPPLPTQEDFEELADQLPLGGVGSNAVALGPEATANGKGMLLGNPHFPWDGSERFYQSHLTIPGEINVAGGSLFGVPIINIGHTDNLAWSHTVSTAYRFTPFELKLVPGDPHSYLYNGQPRRDDRRGRDGPGAQPRRHVTPQTRTLYSSHHGSIFTDLLGIPLPWGADDRVGDGRRERRQLPLPEPLLRGQRRPERGRPDLENSRSSSETRASRGSTRSPPTARATPTTPTSR